MIAPLIFFSLLSGITSLEAKDGLKRIAITSALLYAFTSLVAVSIGLSVGNLLSPEAGLLATEAYQPSSQNSASAPSVGDFLLGLIPQNIVHAISQNLYLQVVAFAIFSGIVMQYQASKCKKVKAVVDEIAGLSFTMIEWIVRLAPLAVLGFTAHMVGTLGADILTSLITLIGVMCIGYALHYCFLGLLIKTHNWAFC